MKYTKISLLLLLTLLVGCTNNNSTSNGGPIDSSNEPAWQTNGELPETPEGIDVPSSV